MASQNKTIREIRELYEAGCLIFGVPVDKEDFRKAKRMLAESSHDRVSAIVRRMTEDEQVIIALDCAIFLECNRRGVTYLSQGYTKFTEIEGGTSVLAMRSFVEALRAMFWDITNMEHRDGPVGPCVDDKGRLCLGRLRSRKATEADLFESLMSDDEDANGIEKRTIH